MCKNQTIFPCGPYIETIKRIALLLNITRASFENNREIPVELVGSALTVLYLCTQILENHFQWADRTKPAIEWQVPGLVKQQQQYLCIREGR